MHMYVYLLSYESGLDPGGLLLRGTCSLIIMQDSENVHIYNMYVLLFLFFEVFWPNFIHK